ncbi:MAG: B12-binding domain-containing radical SAM protein [Clostridia bacterium]
MDLDALPFPERPFIARRKMATLATARGCYGCCSFCSIRAFYQDLTGPRIRFRSPENIVEEIALLIEHRGVRFINFVDDNFVVNTPQNISRLNRLCDLLEASRFDFQFSITVRANDYIKNEDLLKRLQQVGLKYVFIGIESLIQRQLTLYEKKIEVWENEEAFRLSKRLNLKVDIGFILFDPLSNWMKLSTT